MPYLHWETDRQRETFAGNVEKITEDWIKEKNREKHKNKTARQRRRQDLPRVSFPKPKEEETSFCECALHFNKISLIDFRVESMGRPSWRRPAATTNYYQRQSEYNPSSTSPDGTKRSGQRN